MFDDNEAERVVRFVRMLRHTRGKWAGVPFNLRGWQEHDILRPLFGTVNADGTRQYRTAYISVGRKNGKALALPTVVATPDGWSTIGELKPGARVFDENGYPCSVVAVTDVMENRPCYEVLFSDGARIVADAEHEWLTTARVVNIGTKLRKRVEPTQVRTTRQLYETCHYGTRGDRNHSIRVAGALELPEARLPVPPYVLGVWIGDGNTHDARITIGYEDGEILDNIRACGVSVKEMRSTNANSGDYLLGSNGRRQIARQFSLRATLRRMGLLGRKSVPISYLRASKAQRLELLQGLMDTDGYISAAGQCEFTTIKGCIAKSVVHLVASLGMKPTCNVGRATLNGRDCGVKYRVQFRPTVPVFKLARKLARQKPVGETARSRTRQIVSVEPVESVPVRCIQVDSPSGLFLAGETLIPTHNSEIAAAIALYMLFGDGEPGAEVYSAAADRDQAAIVFNTAAAMVRQSKGLLKRCKIIDSQKRIVIPGTNSFWRVLSAEAYTKHGLNPHCVIFDELHAQPNRDLWDVLTTGFGAREQPLLVAITTAGYDRNSICYEQYDYARRVSAGEIEDPTYFSAVYEVPAEEEDWRDERVWKAANPALGDFRSLDELRQMAARAENVPALQNTFRRLYLNQWTEQSERWIDMEAWDASAGTVNVEELAGRECYGGLDLASTTDIAALALVFPGTEEGDPARVLMHYWIPADQMQERVNRDRVPYDVWVRDGRMTATEGNVIDYAAIRQHILEASEKYNIREIAFDRWGAIQLVQELEGEGLTMVPMGQGFASMSAPTKEFLTRILGKTLWHGGDPVLRWMAGNVQVKQDAAANLKPDKSASTEKIDGIVAAIMGLDRVIRHEQAAPSVYEERGLIVL